MITRAPVAIAAVVVLAGPLFADTAAPDSRAVQAGDEANLESNAPRSGLTLSFSVGGGIVIGGNGSGDTGVGRGEQVSFRIGHVATRDTVLTFEFTGGSRFHESNVTGASLEHDDDFNFMAGALVYVAPSLWLRAAGGLSVITFDDSAGMKAHAGIGGLAGAGVDFVRWRQLVLGAELWGLTSIVAVRGMVFDGALCLGLTYY